MLKNIILVIIVLVTSLKSQDLSGNSLFADHKSREIGDLLLVVISESASASNESKTTTSNSNSLSASASGSGKLDFIPNMGLSGSGSQSYSGSGKIESKGAFKTSLAVRIKEILNNGDYIIEGSKSVGVNGETKITKLSGIVRQEDIMDDNSIDSEKIGNLMISYNGKGVIQEAEDPGVITRFFNWLF